MNGNPHSVLWRRIDEPGHEGCRLVPRNGGWQILGSAVFSHLGEACRLAYTIHCNSGWRTLSAAVSGWVGERDIHVEVACEETGIWRLNGAEVPAVAGCLDVDLSFSPSTNSLPIRRLDLAIGESAQVRAAWLRFPDFTLEPLEQSYTRLAADRYRYESAGGWFVAEVTVDGLGLVLDYGEIWRRERPV
jgi:hypothetical protein